MATLKADRRLYVTADRERIVEEGDSRAAYLLAAEGRNIGEGDVAKYRLRMLDSRIVWPAIEPKMVVEPAVKDVAEPADKTPKWTLAMPPAEYLERYGDDAKNSALAKAVIQAAEG